MLYRDVSEDLEIFLSAFNRSVAHSGAMLLGLCRLVCCSRVMATHTNTLGLVDASFLDSQQCLP